MKQAVISLFNTPSGRFTWWDKLALGINDSLECWGIEHKFFFKEFTEHSIIPHEIQNIATEDNLNSSEWLEETLQGYINKFEKIIIHTHSFFPPTRIRQLLRKNPNVTWCATEHRIGSSSTSFIKRQLKVFLRAQGYLPKYIISVSQAGLIRNKDLFGSHNQFCIINGIDLNKYTHKKLQPRKNLQHRALYVGRISTSKGIWLLLETIHYIVHSLNNTLIVLDVVGGNSDEVDELNRCVESLGIKDYVNILGYQTNPKPFIEQADFVVIPTIIEEALSLAALEARAIGTPVVYALSGGLPETMIPYKTGVPILHLTKEGIAKAFLKLINETGLINGIKEETEQYMNYFDQNRMIFEYQTVYNKIFKEI
jgi:glycosyltransferase involved in cell wall biosynthesis